MIELIGGIFALLLGALGVLFAQRNSERKKADAAERKAEQVTAVREKERDIDQARASAREQSAEKQREAEKRPAGQRPGGSFRQ